STAIYTLSLHDALPIYLLEGIKRLMLIEDQKLFPNAMLLLTKEDWEEFYEGDEEIGWMLKEKPAPFPNKDSKYIHPSEDKTDRTDRKSTRLNSSHVKIS